MTTASRNGTFPHDARSAAPLYLAQGLAPIPYPRELPQEAFRGLAGDFVHLIEPISEADPAALLGQLLVAFGSVIGSSAHIWAEGNRYQGNEFLVLVGRSAKARKGTCWSRVCQLLEKVEPHWAADCIQSGDSSGEGIIWAVRETIHKRERIRDRGEAARYELVEADPGIQA